MIPSKVILVLFVGLMTVVLQIAGTLNLLYPRKPFLRYLHRKGLRALAGKFPQGYNNQHQGEEHYHHFYLNNPAQYGIQYGVPNPFLSLHPPTILPGGKLGHSQYSLYSPLIDGKLTYDNYWNFPYPPLPWGPQHL